MPIELHVRRISENRRNSYLVAIVACCRGIFNEHRHCKCVEANSKEEAQRIFDQQNSLDTILATKDSKIEYTCFLDPKAKSTDSTRKGRGSQLKRDLTLEEFQLQAGLDG